MNQFLNAPAFKPSRIQGHKPTALAAARALAAKIPSGWYYGIACIGCWAAVGVMMAWRG